MHQAELDPRDLRRAFGAFATGVTVVTTTDEAGLPCGFTANSFTSVSLEPPLVLVCIAKSAGCYDVFAGARSLAVNILSSNQQALSGTFAAPNVDRFAGLNWAAGETGCPRLSGVVAWLDCEMHQTVDAGDHLVLIGRVVAYDYNAEPPLGYCRGAYVSFALAQQALLAAQSDGPIRVGAIVERDGAILLQEESDSGGVRLPTSPRLGGVEDPDSLMGKLAADGVKVRLPFLFAIYDEGDTHCVYYRGEVPLGAKPSTGGTYRFVGFDDIPWQRIADPALRTMLDRYVRERETDSFGLYTGDAASGHVQTFS